MTAVGKKLCLNKPFADGLLLAAHFQYMVTALYLSFNGRKSILRNSEIDGYIMTYPQSIISVEPLPKRAQGVMGRRKTRNSNGSRLSVWEASESMGCLLRRWNFFNSFSLTRICFVVGCFTTTSISIVS